MIDVDELEDSIGPPDEVRLTRTVLAGSKRLDRLSLLAQAGTQIAPEQAEKLAQRSSP